MLKYVELACDMGLQWTAWVRCDHYPIGCELERGKLEHHFIRACAFRCAVDASYGYFLGISALKNHDKAIEALPKFDSGSYGLNFDAEGSHYLRLSSDHDGFYYYDNFVREYLDFLFESNQFLPFFTLSFNTDFYSAGQWKHCALGELSLC